MTPSPRIYATNLWFGPLGDFDDFAGADAAGAGVNGFGGAVDERADAAEVRVPAPARQVMRVTDAVAEVRLLAADVARFGHPSPSPVVSKRKN